MSIELGKAKLEWDKNYSVFRPSTLRSYYNQTASQIETVLVNEDGIQVKGLVRASLRPREVRGAGREGPTSSHRRQQ